MLDMAGARVLVETGTFYSVHLELPGTVYDHCRRFGVSILRTHRCAQPLVASPVVAATRVYVAADMHAATTAHAFRISPSAVSKVRQSLSDERPVYTGRDCPK
jgi:hypothetical protein